MPDEMKIAFRNGNDPAYEAMLNDLMLRVFGFSFAPWHALKIWNSDYESYAIIEDGVMLSNVCVYKMRLRIQGQTQWVHQFGAVATRPGSTHKGLAGALMRHVLQKYPDTPSFLFANDGAASFYSQFGFAQIEESKLTLPYRIHNAGVNAVKRAHDDPAILRLLDENACFSAIFDCTGAQPVQRFNLMAAPDDIYYMPAPDAMAVARQSENVLYIDAFAARGPHSFDEIAACLPFQGIENVIFGFCPDFLGIPYDKRLLVPSDSLLFASPHLRWPRHFTFPALCIT